MIADHFEELMKIGIIAGLGFAGVVTLIGLGVGSSIDLLKLFGGVR
ncbi:hypothetical protein NST74_29890 [Paenibacillus sp. FSL F4-0125]